MKMFLFYLHHKLYYSWYMIQVFKRKGFRLINFISEQHSLALFVCADIGNYIDFFMFVHNLKYFIYEGKN